MNAWELKLVPALVAVAVVIAAVVLAVLDHAEVAWAVTLVGMVAQTFLPGAVRVIPPNDRITDPDMASQVKP